MKADIEPLYETMERGGEQIGPPNIAYQKLRSIVLCASIVELLLLSFYSGAYFVDRIVDLYIGFTASFFAVLADIAFLCCQPTHGGIRLMSRGNQICLVIRFVSFAFIINATVQGAPIFDCSRDTCTSTGKLLSQRRSYYPELRCWRTQERCEFYEHHSGRCQDHGEMWIVWKSRRSINFFGYGFSNNSKSLTSCTMWLEDHQESYNEYFDYASVRGVIMCLILIVIEFGVIMLARQALKGPNFAEIHIIEVDNSSAVEASVSVMHQNGFPVAFAQVQPQPTAFLEDNGSLVRENVEVRGEACDQARPNRSIMKSENVVDCHHQSLFQQETPEARQIDVQVPSLL